MQFSNSNVDDLRIPVQRVRVEVHTERERHAVVLFVAPGARPEDIFDNQAAFFPAEDEGTVRLYARSSVVRLVAEADDASPLSLASLGVACHGRSITVHLSTGEALTGALMSFSPHLRTLDLLNHAGRSFALHANGKVHHVAKVYVQRIEDAPMITSSDLDVRRGPLP